MNGMALHPEGCECVSKKDIIEYFEEYYSNTQVTCFMKWDCAKYYFWNADTCQCEKARFINTSYDDLPDLPDLVQCSSCLDN